MLWRYFEERGLAYNLLAWSLELDNQFKYRFQTLEHLASDGYFSYCTLRSSIDLMYH